MNLESLYEQIKAPTTTKMASILDVTDSAYYPVFRSMYRNVVAALNEALDITLFLLPLTQLFKVHQKTQCLKITQKVTFEFSMLGNFPLFVLLKMACLVTLFDRILLVIKNGPFLAKS